MSGAAEWLASPHVEAWAARQRRFKAMQAADYARELTDLIDYAGMELPAADADRVLLDAFQLIRLRLGIRVETQFVLTAR